MYYLRPLAWQGTRTLVMALVVLALAGMPAGAQTTQPVTEPPAREEAAKPVGVGDLNVRETRPGIFDEIHYRNADIRGVLQLLSSQGRRNIVASKEVTGTFTADLYDVTFKEALEAILNASGYVYVEKGNFIYVYTPQQLEEIKKAQRKMTVRTYRLAYITAADAKTLIAPALSGEGSTSVTPASAVGISPSSTETGGNNYATDDVLVVRDYEDNVARVTEIITKVDVKPQQVLIEATILRATLTEKNALGVDFNCLAGIDFQAMGASTSGLQSLTTGVISGADLNRRAATFRTDFNTAIPAGGMTIGFLSNEVAFFIRALETVTDVTVMANPKLLVINKQRGEVMVGDRDGYLTTTVTETTATQTVEFLETGTRLLVRPFIGRNGYVRLEIHPEDSSGSVVQVGLHVLPSETTTEVTSNVLVRDGHTIVIGGLFRERTQDGRGQVPLVGNIPYLGTLFRNTVDDTKREEVIILITPRIIKQESDEAVSEQIKQDVERFRIGQRKGLRWWGRGRLAQSCMRSSKRSLTEGNYDSALWKVDMALSLQPRMEEAIRLKERLTKKAFWSDESQYSVAKTIIERMIMQDLGKPVERIVSPDRPRDSEKIEPEVREVFGIKDRPEDPLPPEALPEQLPEVQPEDNPQDNPGSTPEDDKEVSTEDKQEEPEPAVVSVNPEIQPVE